MAIVIDFEGKELRKKTPISAVTKPEKPADLQRADYDACKHGRTLISEEKRTVTCKDCGAAVDPFAYILFLYRHYETRVDQRLAAIKEAEKREADKQKRRDERERQPRRRRIERRAETAERAAYNEYQAKVLSARALRQRQLVEKLDQEIAAMPSDDAERAHQTAEGMKVEA